MVRLQLLGLSLAAVIAVGGCGTSGTRSEVGADGDRPSTSAGSVPTSGTSDGRAEEVPPDLAELLALRRTFGKFPVAANVSRVVLTDLGALAQSSQVAEVTIESAAEVGENVLLRAANSTSRFPAVDVVVPFTVDRWLKPSSGPTSSELVITVSRGEELKEQGGRVAEELAARVPVGSRAIFFTEPGPGSYYRAAEGGTLFLTGDDTAVSMEPTLTDEGPVGLVPLTDLVEQVRDAD